MTEIREKAEMYHKTLEKAIEDDAVWLIRHKYKLEGCTLRDDPDANVLSTIPLSALSSGI